MKLVCPTLNCLVCGDSIETRGVVGLGSLCQVFLVKVQASKDNFAFTFSFRCNCGNCFTELFESAWEYRHIIILIQGLGLFKVCLVTLKRYQLGVLLYICLQVFPHKEKSIS